jgi:hypothetical protein
VATNPTEWEYTTGSCDVWELHHLCNHYAYNGGWEPVLAVESHQGVKLPERIGDDNGPVRNYQPLKPYEVLFRRVIKTEDDDAA